MPHHVVDLQVVAGGIDVVEVGDDAPVQRRRVALHARIDDADAHPCPVRPAARAARALVTDRCASNAGSCGLAGGGVVGGGVVGVSAWSGRINADAAAAPASPHAVNAIAIAAASADFTLIVRSIDSFP